MTHIPEPGGIFPAQTESHVVSEVLEWRPGRVFVPVVAVLLGRLGEELGVAGVCGCGAFFHGGEGQCGVEWWGDGVLVMRVEEAPFAGVLLPVLCCVGRLC